MPSKLHQNIAIVSEKAKTAIAIITETVQSFGKANLFQGVRKAVKYFDAAQAEKLNSIEETVPTTTVKAKLEYLLDAVGSHLDVVAQIDLGNTLAKGEINVPGFCIKDVPAVTLLAFEKQLRALRTVYLAVPTLQNGIMWGQNANAGDQLYFAPEEVDFKTVKETTAVVLYPHTDKHPAQVKEVSKDVEIAKILTVKSSGLITSVRKSQLLARIDILLEAVVKARELANEQLITTDSSLSKKLKDYLLA